MKNDVISLSRSETPWISKETSKNYERHCFWQRHLPADFRGHHCLYVHSLSYTASGEGEGPVDLGAARAQGLSGYYVLKWVITDKEGFRVNVEREVLFQ